MGNLGGGEILVILLVALIVLGPTKLPPAVRQVGKVVGEIRRIGQGFQQELREAAKPLQEATADLKAADKSLRETTQKPLKEMTDTLKAADPRKAIAPPPPAQDKDKDDQAAAPAPGVPEAAAPEDSAKATGAPEAAAAEDSAKATGVSEAAEPGPGVTDGEKSDPEARADDAA